MRHKCGRSSTATRPDATRPRSSARSRFVQHLFVRLLGAGLPGLAAPGLAPAATLAITLDDTTRMLSTEALLARPDRRQIVIDGKAGPAASVQAVPLGALLADQVGHRRDTLDIHASDGFTSELPLSLAGQSAAGAARAWLAIEEAGHPWHDHGGHRPGPFAVVWTDPKASAIGSEQWVDAVVSITAVASPSMRWPALAVSRDVPAAAPAHRGEMVFAQNCLPCHRIGGAGAGDKGPDLGQPMNATAYLTPGGMHALIRDPRSVRTWPQQAMPPFPALSDGDIDAVIAYVRQIGHQADGRKAAAPG